MTLIGAGLPQLVGQTGKAKSYARRLFEFTSIGALSEAQARAVLVEPAIRSGARFDDDALRGILA